MSFFSLSSTNGTDRPGRPLQGDASALRAEQLGVVVGGGGVGGRRHVVVEPLDRRAGKRHRSFKPSLLHNHEI